MIKNNTSKECTAFLVAGPHFQPLAKNEQNQKVTGPNDEKRDAIIPNEKWKQ